MAILLASLPDPHGWAGRLSPRMAAMIELVPPAGSPGAAPWDEARAGFARFHARWLAYCLETGALDRVPAILSVLQGRDLAARLLDELGALDKAGALAGPVAAYQSLRLELRNLQARIQAVVEGGRGATPGGTRPDAGPARAARQAAVRSHAAAGETFAALDARYRRLLADLPRLRDKAAEVPGFAALVSPRLDAARLTRERRRPGEGLVLLLDLAAAGVPVAGALVLRADRPPAWRPLPALPGIAKAVDQASQRLGSRLAACPCRYTPQTAFADASGRRADAAPAGTHDPDADLADFWQRQTEAMKACLWTPLAPLLDGLAGAVCITQGALHLLPLDAGAPQGLTLIHYPGLVFYGYRRGLLGAGPSRADDRPDATGGPDGAIGLVGFGGVDDTIPFVHAEVAALADLHAGGGRPVHARDPYAEDNASGRDASLVYALLHIACHGAFRGLAHPALETGPGRLVDMGRIMERRLRVYQVLIAACLGGQVREALDGEPSGIAGGYFYGGARQVVASVVALPDNWTMLTCLLIHQAWLTVGDLGQAVAEGKRRLAAGDWFADTESRFVTAAAAALATWEPQQQRKA